MVTREDTRINRLRAHIHEIIFEADTPSGKAFDIALLIAIITSVIVVMLETVASLEAKYSSFFYVTEWIVTIFFSIEYALRIFCVRRPFKYIFSFYGIIDLLSILPTYLDILLPINARSFMIIRALRLLRIFRIFKLGKFLKASDLITKSLRASRVKITVFIVFVLLMVVVIGSLMYLIEGGGGPDSTFTSIPRSIYWAIVTLTTVGYGDIYPTTPIGQAIAAFVMILGYGVIAVPTGIVTAEIALLSHKEEEDITTQACPSCMKEGHDSDAIFCKYCGEEMEF